MNTPLGSSNSSPSAAPVERLVALLRGFSAALTRLSLYPAKHPNAVEAIEAALSELNAVTESFGAVELIVGPDYLEAGGEHLPGDKALESLARRLHELDVASIRFEPGAELPELQKALELLQGANAEEMSGQGLVKGFEAAGVSRFQLIPIDYDLLVFAAGTSGEVKQQDCEAIWRGFAASVLNPNDASSLTPEQMAELAMAQASQAHGDGGAQFRLQVQSLLQQMRGMSDEDGTEAFKRLGRFATSLDEGLQDQLLTIFNDAQEQAGPVDGASIATEATDILESLRSIDQELNRAPEETLRLFKRLAQFMPKSSQPKRPGDAGEDAGGEGEQAGELVAGAKSSLDALFHKRSSQDYSPDDYQKVLDASAEGAAPIEKITIEHAYLDPNDHEGVTEHASKIAVYLASRHDEGEECPSGPFTYLHGQVETLLEQQRFDLLSEAAEAVMSYHEAHGRLAKRGARRFSGVLRDEETIRQALGAYLAGGGYNEVPLSVLRAGGGHALAAILDAWNETDDSTLRDGLKAFVRSSPVEALVEAVGVMAESGWWRVRSLLDVIEGLDEDVLMEVLTPLMHDGDPCVRFEAFSLVDVRRPVWAETILRQALDENDERVGAMALRRLEQQTDEYANGFLVEYLNEAVGSESPVPANVLGVARLLAGRGSICLTAVCEALGATMKRFTERDAEIAEGLVEILSEHEDEPEVELVLRGWKRSPSRLLNLVTRRGRPKKEGPS
jgi:hypothetical protein